jgi:hypothetical protein
MESAINFVQRNFLWIFLLGVVWIAFNFVRRFQYHAIHGVKFPPPESQQILFRERKVSGNSSNPKFKPFGLESGAAKVLEVIVTDSEVWIRAPFPHNAFALQLDLEHRITKSAISRVESAKPRGSLVLRLHFIDGSGNPCRYSLILSDPDAFLKALGLPAEPASTSSNGAPNNLSPA